LQLAACCSVSFFCAGGGAGTDIVVRAMLVLGLVVLIVLIVMVVLIVC
jgi:hypothetical protein